MEHVGIDLGARRSHVVTIDSDGKQLRREIVPTTELGAWLGLRPPSRVVMEACTQSPAVARLSSAAGHETMIVPGSVVRALGVGARGIKTDFRDAEALARACARNESLPSVHVRSETSCVYRETLAARSLLVEQRKHITLSIKSWFRGHLVVLTSVSTGKSFAMRVKTAAAAHALQVPPSLEMLLATHEHLTAQIAVLDERVRAIADTDPTCQRLMSMPGVGPIIAASFSTHLDSIERFPTAEHLASYLALAPGESTTGGKIVRTSTLKAGPTYLKSMLVQGAWSAWRTRPNDPMVLWARQIAEKRGVRIAIVALARKMSAVLYGMWKHGTTYDPSRASTVRAKPTPPLLTTL
jgi:transposase